LAILFFCYPSSFIFLHSLVHYFSIFP
jgi:hypothetical protein